MGRDRDWTPERVKGALVRRFYTRFHMSLILVSCGLAAMLANAAMHKVGVTSMLARHPAAIFVAYAVFLLGVWIWLHYVGIKKIRDSAGDSLDAAPDVNIPGSQGGGGSWGGGGGCGVPRGGGSFDGGGASAAWAEGPAAANVRVPVAVAGDGAGGKALGDLAGGGDGDFFLVVLAIALVAAILLASGWLVYAAPDILAEAAFGALLAGGLAKRAKGESVSGWLAGVVRKTWWPFAIVLVISIVFAGYVETHYPKATTVKEAFAEAARSE